MMSSNSRRWWKPSASAGNAGKIAPQTDTIKGDRGYDSEPHPRWLRGRGINPILARRRTERGSGLGVYRWVVERTLSWLHQFCRLRIRYERRADIHEAFLWIDCALICWRFLRLIF